MLHRRVWRWNVVCRSGLARCRRDNEGPMQLFDRKPCFVLSHFTAPTKLVCGLPVVFAFRIAYETMVVNIVSSSSQSIRVDRVWMEEQSPPIRLDCACQEKEAPGARSFPRARGCRLPCKPYSVRVTLTLDSHAWCPKDDRALCVDKLDETTSALRQKVAETNVAGSMHDFQARNDPCGVWCERAQQSSSSHSGGINDIALPLVSRFTRLCPQD
jgi:hypothetical protein